MTEAGEVGLAEGLLGGLKVLEMSHVMAAPTCGLMLADMGADVIKIERSNTSDDVRRNAPFVEGHSAPFTMMNRNKRAIAINMRSEAGRAALRRMLMEADVFIENYRTGAMAHYGIAYDDVKEACPKLIYLSLSGFGQTGPYGSRGGFDLVAQGMSGLMSITGEGEGRPPVKVGTPITDITAGILAAMGVLAAVIQRNRTGRGQFLDTSLYEAGITQTYWQSAIYLASGNVPGAMGSAHPLMAPYQAFPTGDGWINVGGANQANWEKLARMLGLADLISDERFLDGNLRLQNLSQLEAILNEAFATQSTEHWLKEMEAAGIPAGPVYDIAQMAADPHTKAREMIRDVANPDGPTIQVLGHPVKFSDADTPINRPAPRYGQHSREVLVEYGFSASEIEALATEKDVLDDPDGARQ